VDRQLALGHDAAGVDAGVDVMRRDAGHAVALCDRPDQRGDAAVAREQRRVEVDGRPLERSQQPLAEQLGVIDGEQELGTVPGDRRDRDVVVDFERREHRDPASDGMALQRRLPGVVDPPGRDNGEDVARRQGLEQDVEHEAGRLVVPGQQDATHATDGRSMHPQ
jgi:hypothetical protein